MTTRSDDGNMTGGGGRRTRRGYAALLKEATDLKVDLTGIRKNDIEGLRKKVEAARHRKQAKGEM